MGDTMENKEEKAYLELLKELLNSGVEKGDRTGTGTKALFARSLRFDLSKGFPLLTTKKVHFKSVLVELLWFLKGETNIKFLKEHKVTIWDEWSDENGELGPVYGKMWRDFPVNKINKQGVRLLGVDQIQSVIEQIRSNPDSRRHLVSAWHPGYLDEQKLPPCHYSFQFIVHGKKLHCLFNMRSVDTFLGLPFNIASYALLTHIIADQTGLEVGELVFNGCDVHLYNNHISQAQEQISREPKSFPRIKILNSRARVEDYEVSDFVVEGYDPHPAIKAPVAV
jgi:thymidylate synthase